MNNYFPLLYGEVISYPCSNTNARFVNLLVKKADGSINSLYLDKWRLSLYTQTQLMNYSDKKYEMV